MFPAAVVLFGLCGCTSMHTCTMTTTTAVVHCAAVTHEWPASSYRRRCSAPSMVDCCTSLTRRWFSRRDVVSRRAPLSSSSATHYLLASRVTLVPSPTPQILDSVYWLHPRNPWRDPWHPPRRHCINRDMGLWRRAKRRHTTIVAVYRPPGTVTTAFCDLVSDLFDQQS